MAPPRVGVGDVAPDFKLEGTEDRDYTLSEYRGQPVVLVFYPGDNTPVCTRQFCSYRDDSETMEKLDAVVVGISAQSEESHIDTTVRVHDVFISHASEDKAVARAYGVTRPVVGTQRAAFVIDENGVIEKALYNVKATGHVAKLRRDLGID